MINKNKYSYSIIKCTIIIIAIMGMYVFPIILANRCYNDDLIRTLTGVTGWKGDGRPLTEFIVEILGGASDLAIDVAPFPLFIAIIILSFSLAKYGKEVLGFIASEIEIVMIVSLFIMHPFLISVFQFKFDVIGMITPLALIIILFSYEFTNRFICCVLSMACGTAVMLLYQPAIGDIFGFFG